MKNEKQARTNDFWIIKLACGAFIIWLSTAPTVNGRDNNRGGENWVFLWEWDERKWWCSRTTREGNCEWGCERRDRERQSGREAVNNSDPVALYPSTLVCISNFVFYFGLSKWAIESDSVEFWTKKGWVKWIDATTYLKFKKLFFIKWKLNKKLIFFNEK